MAVLSVSGPAVPVASPVSVAHGTCSLSVAYVYLEYGSRCDVSETEPHRHRQGNVSCHFFPMGHLLTPLAFVHTIGLCEQLIEVTYASIYPRI